MPSLWLRETRASELMVPSGRIHTRRNRQKIHINIKGTNREREGNVKSVSDCISFLLLCDQLPQIQQLKNHIYYVPVSMGQETGSFALSHGHNQGVSQAVFLPGAGSLPPRAHVHCQNPIHYSCRLMDSPIFLLAVNQGLFLSPEAAPSLPHGPVTI